MKSADTGLGKKICDEKVETENIKNSFQSFCSGGEQQYGMAAGRRCGGKKVCLLFLKVLLDLCAH